MPSAAPPPAKSDAEKSFDTLIRNWYFTLPLRLPFILFANAFLIY